MNVGNVRTIEEQIIKLTVKELLQSGFQLSVIDTKDVILLKTDERYLITSALHNDSENIINCYSNDELLGYVMLVYGSNGYDVISKVSESIKPYMRTTLELCEYLKQNNLH